MDELKNLNGTQLAYADECGLKELRRVEMWGEKSVPSLWDMVRNITFSDASSQIRYQTELYINDLWKD